jgi:hypothetical protein
MLKDGTTKSEASKTSTTTLDRDPSIFNEKGGTTFDEAQSAHTHARLRRSRRKSPATCNSCQLWKLAA